MAASANDMLQKVGVAGTLTSLSAPGHSISGTTITVGSTTNWPTDTGVTFAIRQVDSSGVLVAGTYTEWRGVVSGSTLTGMVLAYGTDQVYPAGSTTQVYIPVSAYSHNRMIDALTAEHSQLDGTHTDITADSVASAGPVSGTTGTFTSDITEKGSTLTTQRDELVFDHVASGCVWSGDSYGSTLAASMTSGVIYLAGKRLTVATVTARAFTASKDTYVDLSDSGSGTATITYTEVANNAASPALTAGRMRIAVVVTGASNIASVASINQGQPQKSLPSTCNPHNSGLDSLGNRIYNEDPTGEINFVSETTLGGGPGDLLSMTLPLLENMRIDVSAHISTECVNTPSCSMFGRLYVDGTLVRDTRIDTDSTAKVWASFPTNYRGLLTSGSKIVKSALAITGGGSFQYTAVTIRIKAKPTRLS